MGAMVAQWAGSWVGCAGLAQWQRRTAPARGQAAGDLKVLTPLLAISLFLVDAPEPNPSPADLPREPQAGDSSFNRLVSDLGIRISGFHLVGVLGG
jgi:hypothetical protein